MIIIRYLVKETLKSQLAILFILLLIFFCQKLVRILGAAVDGDVPTNLVLTLLGLGVPDMAQLILPLSLFLALLMTLGKLYTDSEITVMHACGLGKMVLIKAAMILMLFTAVAATINVIWIGPWSERQQQQVTDNAQANPGSAALAAGQFRSSSDGNFVLFIDNVKNNNFANVFLAQLRPRDNRRPSVVVAEKGHMQQYKDGSQVVLLDKGSRYEGTALLRDFKITDFTNYRALIGYKQTLLDPNDASQADMKSLWNSSNPEFRAELHWRFTLIFSVMVMALIVVPLSEVNPRQGRVLSMLPAILLYLIFFLLQSSFKTNVEAAKFDPIISMWVVNISYLLTAIVLNCWDSLPARKFKAFFQRKGAA